MVHVLLIYGICAFAFGVTSISITFMCSKYSRNTALKKFSVFFILFSLQVFVGLLCGYLYNDNSGVSDTLLSPCFLISLFFYSLLLCAIAVFPLVLFRSPWAVFFSFVFLIIYAAYYLLILRGIAWQIPLTEYSVAPYIGPLTVFTLFGTNLWSLLYSLLHYRNADKDARDLLRFILPLLVFFLPAWLADVFLPPFFTLLFSLTLYILFGILLLRFSLKIFRAAVVTHHAPDLSAWSAELGLSNREREILALMLQGKENSGIGNQLFISINTVKTHVKSILKKTGATDRFSLLLKISRLKDDQAH